MSDLKVHVYYNTAAGGLYEYQMKGTYKGQDISGKYRFTDTGDEVKRQAAGGKVRRIPPRYSSKHSAMADALEGSAIRPSIEINPHGALIGRRAGTVSNTTAYVIWAQLGKCCCCGSSRGCLRTQPSSMLLPVCDSWRNIPIYPYYAITLIIAEDTMIEDLYDLIGGRSTIEAATKLFYDKILQDDSLRHFFEGVDVAHLRSRQAMLISMLLGGRVYTGKIFVTPMPGPEIRV